MRIAIVIHRYGEEVVGGAETAARWVAEHLAAHADVHVLTTCALDYTTWQNSYPAGEHHLNGVKVIRFPVDVARDWQRAQKTTGLFLKQERTLDEELAWVRREGPFSSPLLKHIAEAAPDYDAFIFFTYLYATTCFGLPLVAEKAILVPTAHDEPFLYMEVFRRLCHLPAHLIYLTHAEQTLVERITGNGQLSSDVIGLGIAAPDSVSATRFRRNFGVKEAFLLYGGRISEAKNVPELCAHFQRYKQDRPGPLKLLLMGPAHIPITQHPDILPLGVLSESDKFDALSAAGVVVLPSIFESLSILILEAWLLSRPVLVNGRCTVTKRQCQLSNGGLHYSSYAEFAAALDRLLGSPELSFRLGRQGQQFVAQNYTWNSITTRYLQVLANLTD